MSKLNGRIDKLEQRHAPKQGYGILHDDGKVHYRSEIIAESEADFYKKWPAGVLVKITYADNEAT